MADDSFAVTNRNRVRRMPDRGRFDRTTVYDILDAAMVAHIAYVIDGQPYRYNRRRIWQAGSSEYRRQDK